MPSRGWGQAPAPPAGYCVLAPADNNNPRNEAKKHQILTTPPASGTAAEGKSGLPAAEKHVLESGGRKVVNHGFQGKMEGKKWRNFGILPEFYVPKKQKHRTSFAQSTALSPLKYGTFSQRSPYFSVFHARISTPSVAPEGKKDRKTEGKRSRTAARNDTENLKIFWQNENPYP